MAPWEASQSQAPRHRSPFDCQRAKTHPAWPAKLAGTRGQCGNAGSRRSPVSYDSEYLIAAVITGPFSITFSGS
jgi:hypothetical protein